MDALGVKPKLRLGKKIEKGGMESFGPMKVKFLAEPEGVTKKNFEGKPAKFLKFLVEYNGKEYHWYAGVLDKDGQPNYLLERTALLEVGFEYILEMKKKGIINYIDIRNIDGTPIQDEPNDDEPAEGINYDDEDDEDPNIPPD